MAIQPNEIVLVFSGGSGNHDPRRSIGGAPSGFPVPPAPKNNLFDNISAKEAENGYRDFRCVYIFNQSTDGKLGGMKVAIANQVEGGGTVSIGVAGRSDTQRILVSGAATGGTFVLGYSEGGKQYPVTVPYDADPDVWASNMETAFQAQPLRQ